MIILKAVQGVFTVFFMISIGYFLAARKWFDDNTQLVFSKLVVNVALPGFMAYSLTSNYDRDKLLGVAGGSLLPLISMMITFSLAIVLTKVLHISKERQGTFKVAFALSNTVFIGLPVNLSLFGEISVPFVILYYICNTTFFWTLGVYEIRKDIDDSGKLFTKENLKKIINPPIVTFFITIIIILLNLKLPEFLLDGFKYIGNLTTPLSTMFIGIVLYSLKLKDLKLDRDMLIILMGRFIVCPLVTALIVVPFNIPLLMKKVFIIQAAMPVMTQISIVNKAYGGNYKYPAVLGAVSTAISLIFIPIYMIIFSYL